MLDRCIDSNAKHSQDPSKVDLDYRLLDDFHWKLKVTDKDHPLALMVSWFECIMISTKWLTIQWYILLVDLFFYKYVVGIRLVQPCTWRPERLLSTVKILYNMPLHKLPHLPQFWGNDATNSALFLSLIPFAMSQLYIVPHAALHALCKSGVIICICCA